MLEIICFKNSNRNFGFIWLHFLEFCCCCHFEGEGGGGGGGGEEEEEVGRFKIICQVVLAIFQEHLRLGGRSQSRFETWFRSNQRCQFDLIKSPRKKLNHANIK